MASLNGTVWSCQQCNVTNVAEASQQIFQEVILGQEYTAQLEAELDNVDNELDSEIKVLKSHSSEKKYLQKYYSPKSYTADEYYKPEKHYSYDKYYKPKKHYSLYNTHKKVPKSSYSSNQANLVANPSQSSSKLPSIRSLSSSLGNVSN